MAEDTLPKYTVRIEGNDGSSNKTHTSNSIRRLIFGPGIRVVEDTSVTPPALRIDLAPDLEERLAAVEAILATVSVAAIADTIAKRNVDGELNAVNFRGDLRSPGDPDPVRIKTDDNQVVLSAGKVNGNPAASLNGVPLNELPISVSIAGGDAAIRAALVSFGLFVEVA